MIGDDENTKHDEIESHLRPMGWKWENDDGRRRNTTWDHSDLFYLHISLYLPACYAMLFALVCMYVLLSRTFDACGRRGVAWEGFRELKWESPGDRRVRKMFSLNPHSSFFSILALTSTSTIPTHLSNTAEHARLE